MYEIVKKRKKYFPKLVSDNKKLWKTIKPDIFEQGNFSRKVIISEEKCIISDDRGLSEIFNGHFISITKTLLVWI